jgi:hypothetical protein
MTAAPRAPYSKLLLDLVSDGPEAKPRRPAVRAYQAVYNAIADSLDDDNYDGVLSVLRGTEMVLDAGAGVEVEATADDGGSESTVQQVAVGLGLGRARSATTRSQTRSMTTTTTVCCLSCAEQRWFWTHMC